MHRHSRSRRPAVARPADQKADPAAKRHLAWLLAAAAVVGSAALIVLQIYRQELIEWLLANPQDRDDWLLYAVLLGALITLPLAVFGIWLGRLGLLTARAARYPPPGVRVWRDTPIEEGTAARRKGVAMQLLGIVLLLAALVVPLLLWGAVFSLAAT